MEQEFVINKLISVKLKDNITIIFFRGKPFRQCKYLLLLNPHRKKSQKLISSIDEAEEELIGELESNVKPEDIGLTPLEEFRGHCSNLQVWYECGYDTKLLHRTIAFPLLKKLNDEGDPQAQKIFKEEIAKRFITGTPSVQEYLIIEGYIKLFEKNELDMIAEELPLASCKNLIEDLALKKDISYFIQTVSISKSFLTKLLISVKGKELIEIIICSCENDRSQFEDVLLYLLCNKETFINKLFSLMKHVEYRRNKFEIDPIDYYYLYKSIKPPIWEYIKKKIQAINLFLRLEHWKDLIIFINLQIVDHLEEDDVIELFKDGKLKLMEGIIKTLKHQFNQDFGNISEFMIFLLVKISKLKQKNYWQQISYEIKPYKSVIINFIQYFLFNINRKYYNDNIKKQADVLGKELEKIKT